MLHHSSGSQRFAQNPKRTQHYPTYVRCVSSLSYFLSFVFPYLSSRSFVSLFPPPISPSFSLRLTKTFSRSLLVQSSSFHFLSLRLLLHLFPRLSLRHKLPPKRALVDRYGRTKREEKRERVKTTFFSRRHTSSTGRTGDGARSPGFDELRPSVLSTTTSSISHRGSPSVSLSFSPDLSVRRFPATFASRSPLAGTRDRERIGATSATATTAVSAALRAERRGTSVELRGSQSTSPVSVRRVRPR